MRTFNSIYGDVLVEPQGVLPPKGSGRIPGLDGNAKMSKLLNNAIYLADDANTLCKKIMSMFLTMFTLKIQVKLKVVFTYLDIFDPDKDKVAELKAQYLKIKRHLNEVLENELGPIRRHCAEFAEDIPAVYEMLKRVVKKLMR